VSLRAFRQIPSTPRYTNILFNIPVVCASRYLNLSACFQHSCQGQSSPSISRYRSCNGVINRYKNALDIEQVLFAFLKLLNTEPAMSNRLHPWSRIGVEKLSGAHTGNLPTFYGNWWFLTLLMNAATGSYLCHLNPLQILGGTSF